MSFISGLFRSRDKPTNSINGSSYRFLFGGSTSGKSVNERSAMQMTAVYACVRTSEAVTKTFSMYCTAGEQVQLVEYYSGSKSYYIHSVTVTYQER